MTQSQHHVLVVEDDEMVQAFLALHLEHEGYRVSTAANGRGMLGALAGEDIDLILLDLNLPDGDGLSLAQTVRERSTVPIIIATARKGRDDRLMALGLGADDYLTKPFDPKELILRVRNLLARSGGNAGPSGSEEAARSLPAPAEDPGAGSEAAVLHTWIEGEAVAEPRRLSRFPVFALVLSVTAAAVVVGAFGFLNPREPSGAPAVVAETPARVPAAPAAAAPVALTLPAVPALESPADPAAMPEEDWPRPLAEILGYGWALESRCAPIPQVQWWKYTTHESIAAYVTRSHKGDWAAYMEKWTRRLAKIQDIGERDSTAITNTGISLRGEELSDYIGKMRDRLAVTRCLSLEAQEARTGEARTGK